MNENINPIIYVNDKVAGLTYGLSEKNDTVFKPTGYFILDDLINRSFQNKHERIEDLIDDIAKQINCSLEYDRNKGLNEYRFTSYMIQLETNEGKIMLEDLDQDNGLRLSEAILKEGKGICVHAGKIIRAVLRHELSNDYTILPLKTNSDKQEEGHDVTLVYSNNGYIIINSKGFHGDNRSVLLQYGLPVKFITRKENEKNSRVKEKNANLSDVIASSGERIDSTDIIERMYSDLMKTKKQ